MKKNLYFLLLITAFLIFTLSCKTFSAANSRKISKEQDSISVSFDEYLTERVWRLAGCYFENGQYIFLDANMTGSLLNFLKNGKFEAASGITNYAGIWKKRTKIKQTEYSFNFQINEKKLIDPSNTIGKSFDSSFERNLINTDKIEIAKNEIKFYSKEGELLLRFIRL